MGLRRCASACSWLAAAALLGCATHPRFDGPLPVRTQQPVQLTAMHLDPMPATPVPEGEVLGRVDAAYSSYWLFGGTPSQGLETDGELLRVGYKARIGLCETVELDTELAFAYANGGFLDSFLINYHEALGLPDQGRADAPRDRFQVRATYADQLAYEMNPNAVELVDLPLALAWHVLPCSAERPFGLAVRGGIELPLGDPDRGYGNGELDYALGLVGEARLGMLAFTGFVQHAFVGTPHRARRIGLSYRDVTAGGLGVEWRVSDDIALLVQTEIESSALRDLGFSAAADAQAQLWLGGRIRLSDGVGLEMSVAEDLSYRTSPDVTGYVGVAFGLR